MSARRVNPHRVKQHFSYTAAELAACLGLHKNTVFNWLRAGLEPVDQSRPLLFHGAAVRAFLLRRQGARKRPCPPGTLYCFRCREPRFPAGRTAVFVCLRPGSGNLRAVCAECQGTMHRRIREVDLQALMPEVAVQITHGTLALVWPDDPPPNCAFERRR